MTLGDLVKEYREKHNISMDEFAKACNLSKGYISMLENNTNPRNNKPIAPTLPTIKKISIAMDMDVDSVLKILDSSQKIVLNYDTERTTDPGQILNFTSSEIKHMKKYRFISEYSIDGTKVVDAVLDREYSIAEKLKIQDEKIKKLESDKSTDNVNNLSIRLINYYYRLASAGTGQIVFDTPPTKRIEIPDTPRYRKVDYAIGVNGNSMEPVYHDGDTLLIEMAEEIEIGETGIFLVDNESYVKKLGEGELISLNPKYNNIPLTENSRCMGKVIDKL